MSVDLAEQAFGTYGLLFCTKAVAKLIVGVRVRVIMSLFGSHYAENASQYAVLVRLSIVSLW